MRNSDYKEEKKKEIMERCFECYCDNGLRDTGIKELGKYCNMTSANLYAYFDNVDDLILQSTAYLSLIHIWVVSPRKGDDLILS